MNENNTRRGFLGVVSAFFASIGSAFMLRKLGSSTPSVPTSARKVDDFGSYAARDKLVDLEDVRPGAADIIDPPDTPVLAHRSLREQDNAILFDESGWWSDDFIERLGEVEIVNDYPMATQGSLTDDEYAAYKRWYRDDYSSETASFGSDLEESEATLSSDSDTREDLDGSDSPSREYVPTAMAVAA